MGKRSDFERISKDYYRTIDHRAVRTLIPHLELSSSFYEPCCGDGILVDQLQDYGITCVGASDTEKDATSYTYDTIADCFVTNPPWTRDILHPLIVNLSNQKPTWLLFDSDWIHTKQSIEYLPRLSTIVSVGRLKWIPNTTMQGKDNCSWYLFDDKVHEYIKFIGRQ